MEIKLTSYDTLLTKKECSSEHSILFRTGIFCSVKGSDRLSQSFQRHSHQA